MQNVEIMTRKGKVETAFEIARAFVYGDRWQANAAWCDRCESYVPMITALTAARLENTTGDEIISRVETRELHHWTTADGAIFVCLGSLIDTDEHLAMA
jgi:hypothetical protein